jgi:plastocyanin
VKRATVAISGLALASIALLAAACSSGGASDDATPAEGDESAAQGDVIQIEQDDFYFDPTELTGEAGKPVTVKLENEGNAAHTFTISELNVDEVVQPGEEATVTFTPTEDGTLTFFCRFHRSQGMEGTLKVGDASASSTGGSAGTSGGATIGY